MGANFTVCWCTHRTGQVSASMYLSSQRSGVTKRKHVVYFERFFLVLWLLCFLAAFIILCLLVGLNHKAKREPAAVVLFMEPMPGSLGALRFLAQRVDVTVEMVVLSTAAWGRDVNHAYDTVTHFLNAMRKEQTLRYDIPVYYGSIHEREGACRVSIDAIDLISPVALLKCRRTHELFPEARKMIATVFCAADVLGSTDPMFEHAKDNATGDAEDAVVED
ncbi:hypothetical protein TRVL_07995 [Trypanosoma vivax]|nr:hypothetical protein TRVL_07995 [Trypanosoma vivax]